MAIVHANLLKLCRCTLQSLGSSSLYRAKRVSTNVPILIKSNFSAPPIVHQRLFTCNSTMSNFFGRLPLKILPQCPERTADELRSLQEQRRAWIKQVRRINSSYSRQSEILEGYQRVKSLSQG
jgi:hypothetical protein